MRQEINESVIRVCLQKVSGIAWAKLEGLPPEEQARAALAAVSICIEEEGAISMEMTLDNLRKRMG